MGPGGIATIIAAISLLAIAGAISYAVFRVARLIDEVKETVKSVNKITSSAEAMSEKITNLVQKFTDNEVGLLKLITGFAISALKSKRSKEHD